jgi:hypothetical protein
VLLFLGVTALGGGIENLANAHGGTYLPAERFDEIPLVDSYVVPGLVLGSVFGVGSLVTAVGMIRRLSWRWLGAVERATGHHWSWAATIVVGIVFVCWLTVELILLGGPESFDTAGDRITAYVIYAVFGSIALALVLLPRAGSVRDHLALDR